MDQNIRELVRNDLKPPTYSEPTRNGVESLIDSIVLDLHEKIEKLRRTLDEIEQRGLESAANAKGVLKDHIDICVKINEEMMRVREIVEEITGPAHQSQQGL